MSLARIYRSSAMNWEKLFSFIRDEVSGVYEDGCIDMNVEDLIDEIRKFLVLEGAL